MSEIEAELSLGIIREERVASRRKACIERTDKLIEALDRVYDEIVADLERELHNTLRSFNA